MTLGQRIKQYRTDNSITLKEFSARSGISVAYVSLLETGRMNHSKQTVPSLQVYYKCANAMDMTLTELLSQIDDDIVSLIPNKGDRERYERMSEIQAIYDQLPESKQAEILAYARWQLERQ